MKNIAQAGMFITCLLLLNAAKLMSQSPDFFKTPGSSGSSELIASSAPADYPGYLSIEPNPVCKSSVVHCTPNLKGGKIIIYDLTGKVMAKFEDVQSGLVTLEKKNLPSGVYLLQLKDNDNTIQVRRIVVE